MKVLTYALWSLELLWNFDPDILIWTYLLSIIFPKFVELLLFVGLDGVEGILDLLSLGRETILAAAAAQTTTVPEIAEERKKYQEISETKMSEFDSRSFK